MPEKSLRLDDLYKMVAYIYSNQSASRSVRATFAHFVEVCGMLTSLDNPKREREGITPQAALCKALAWYFPMLSQLRVASVEELVFRKFPYVCPYCRRCPHDDEICKEVRGTERTVDHPALRGKYSENKHLWPATLNDWQRMFMKIYPRSLYDKGRSTLGLLEELGELAEAIRVFDRYPKYFAGEAADVFSYIMGFANEFGLRERKQDREFSLQDAFLERYPGLCRDCGYSVCACPAIPESTVGRLSKELDLASFTELFSLDIEDLAVAGLDVSKLVWERLGSVGMLPFDRGETNRALMLLCVKAAQLYQESDPDSARQLEDAAVEIGASARYPGTPQQRSPIEPILLKIRAILSRHPRLALEDESPLAARIAVNLSQKLRVLLVFANPRETTPLRLQEEEKAIREAIRLSKARDRISLRTVPATSPDDFRRALLDEQCEILHLSGHGTSKEFVFEDGVGKSHSASVGAIRDLVQRYPSTKCIILNACFALKYLDKPIAPVTIGMDAAVDDKAAIDFSRGFYDGVGAGKSFEEAIEEGRAAAALDGATLPLKVLYQAN